MIVDILGNKWEQKCLACSMTNGDATPPGGIIKKTENFILQQDLETPIKGFMVITSKKHIKSITQLTKDQSLELFELCYDTRQALLSLQDCIECTLIQEERSSHFHIWIFPRYEWMNDLFENSISSIRPIMKYAKENLKTQINIDEIMFIVNQLRTILNHT